jgi:DNA gyrase subunit A
VVQTGTYIWSITNNGMAKATPLDQYPTQGRYGQGVINVRLPQEAAEVVTVVMGSLETELVLKTAVGSTKTFLLGAADVGARAIKPKKLWEVGPPNRITGAVRMVGRLVKGEPERETAVPRQLSLIDSA